MKLTKLTLPQAKTLIWIYMLLLTIMTGMYLYESNDFLGIQLYEEIADQETQKFTGDKDPASICDRLFLTFYTPWDAKEAQENNIVNCTPSDSVQSLMDIPNEE